MVEKAYIENLLFVNIYQHEVSIAMHQQNKIFVVVKNKIYNTCQRFIKILFNGYISLKALLDDFTCQSSQVVYITKNNRIVTNFFFIISFQTTLFA